MADKRNYSEATKSALFALSTKCYEPECKEPTVTIFVNDPKKNVQIAHIRAVSASGPRYNPPGLPEMKTEERNAFPNLILLCEYHHGLVDKKSNEALYSVKLLRRWKELAEKDIRAKVDGLDRLTENRLNEMLTNAATNTKKDISDAIGKLSSVSESAAEVLGTLFDGIQKHYIDSESIAMLYSAAQNLYFLEEGSHLISSASERLGDLESSSTALVRAAELLDGWSGWVARFIEAVGTLEELNLAGNSQRLEQLISDYPRMMQSFPRESSLSESVESVGRSLVDQIEDVLIQSNLGEMAHKVDGKVKREYFLWGFTVGVVMVAATVVTLAVTRTI